MKVSSILCGVLAVSALSISGATAQTRLSLAVPFNDKDASSQHAREWVAEITEKTGGSVVIEPTFNGALVSIPDTMNAVVDGVVDVGVLGISYVSGIEPAFGYTGLLGGMPTENPLTEDALAQIWPQVRKTLAPHGVTALWGESSGFAGAVCPDGHIDSLDDWKGKKVRVGDRLAAAQMQAVGALPVQTGFGEIYLALQNGTVDCVLMIPSLAFSLRLYEVAPYYTNYNVAANIITYLMNSDTLASFSDEERAAIEEASQNAMSVGSGMLRGVMKASLEKWVETGGDVMTVSDEVRQEFLDASAPVFEGAVEATSGEGRKLAEMLHSFQKK